MTQLEHGLELQGRTPAPPITAGKLHGVRLERVYGDNLLYAPGAGEPLGQFGRGALVEFLRLGSASADDVTRYCKRYGVPLLCKHGLPYNHAHSNSKEPYPEECETGVVGTWLTDPDHFGTIGPVAWQAIPVAAVRRLALCFERLVALSAELHQGRTGHTEDWWFISCFLAGKDPKAEEARNAEVVKGWTAEEYSHYFIEDIETARFGFEDYLESLIRLAELQPQFQWDKATREWQLTLVPRMRGASTVRGESNLFALLTFHLMIVIAEKEGFAVCSNCHRTYIPKRTPARNRRNYCETNLCRNARARDAQRDKRARDARARRRAKNQAKR